MERVLTRVAAAWPRALPILVLLAIATAAVWPTWPPLLETWRAMPEYSYGEILAPFIACWIAARTADLPAPSARVSLPAALALLLTTCAWLVAYKAASSIGIQMVAPIILWSAVWMAFGLPIASRLAVPLACLYFAIPVWEFLVPWLQSAAVLVSQTVLGSIGVPVHIDGALVSIPEGTFHIAEACAGRRYFIVCITVAAVLAGTTRMRPLRAAAFLCIAAGLSILTNWIRVLTVIYAGHVTNMTSYLVAREHLSLGWALFAILMVIVCWIGARFAAKGALPRRDRDAGGTYGARELLLRPAVPATVLLLLLPVLAVAYSQYGTAMPHPLDARAADDSHEASSLPPGAQSWRGPLQADAEWRPRFAGADAVERGSYAGSSGTVQVFVARYGSEQRGAKLVSSANALFPADWMVLDRQALDRGTGDPLRDGARLIHAKSSRGEQWLVSYVYGVDRLVTGSDIAVQLAYGVLGWRAPVAARIAAVATRCRPTCEAARARLQRFWAVSGAGLLQ